MCNIIISQTLTWQMAISFIKVSPPRVAQFHCFPQIIKVSFDLELQLNQRLWTPIGIAVSPCKWNQNYHCVQ